MSADATRLLVITGPTATGKTRLGVFLAQRLGGEVVSADSMQVYQRMDIGTAKPTAADTRGVPHHMLDVVSPFEAYSAARYVQEASRCVDAICARGRMPILVGGTGLYIESLLAGRDFAAGAPERRAALEARYAALGGETMLSELAALDPARAGRIHPNDKKRVVRAMEVCEATGGTMTGHDADTKARPPRYDAIRFALNFTRRERLYARIDARVDEMLDAGFLEEVRALLDAGLTPAHTSMQAIGYKELAEVLRGEASLSGAVETIKRRSRQYAKRQETWLRPRADVHWIAWEETPDYGAGLHISAKYLTDAGYTQ
jgi:tRNA dimethylallyltransferase